MCTVSIATIALTEKISNLPTVSANPKKQLDSLLLNADQIKAIRDPTRLKLITGCYSCGKSIVANEIVKQKFYHIRV